MSQTGGMISSMLLNFTLATECKNGFKSTRMEAGRPVTGAATVIHAGLRVAWTRGAGGNGEKWTQSGFILKLVATVSAGGWMTRRTSPSSLLFPLEASSSTSSPSLPKFIPSCLWVLWDDWHCKLNLPFLKLPQAAFHSLQR